MATIDVKVPDIGDFSDVPIIEVHVEPGSVVAVDDPLLTLESDKATMDVPADVSGTVTALNVGVGDTVSRGSVVLTLEPETVPDQPDEAATETETASSRSAAATAPAPAAATGESDLHAEVLVLGAGPGGYSAAFRAADLGKKVVVVDARDTLGGVCLNVGCIPSKALLHAAKVIAETREMSAHGLSFAAPTIDLDRLREWKDGVVARLTGGLAGLAKQRKVTTIVGRGEFT
jgi:dihydrolipoamide dehydrogenase